MKNFSILFVLLATFSKTATSHEAAAFSQKTWPAQIDCSQCATVELLDLQLSVPPDMLKRIKMLNMDGIAFSLEAGDKWLKTQEELIVLLLNESHTTGGLNENGYYEKLRVTNLGDFFRVLHQKEHVTKELQTAREVMGVSNASDFIAYYGESVSAFWVESGDKKNQSIYIVPADKNYSIQISGHLSQATVNALLSSISLVEKHT